MNIKENYPKAYGLIKAQILAELNKNGKLSTEVLNAVPVDSIVQSSIGASVRLLYEVLDKEGVYVEVYTATHPDKPDDPHFWVGNVCKREGDNTWVEYTVACEGTRKEAETKTFTAALELLNSK